MASGALVVLGGNGAATQKYDSSATQNTIPLRDNAGGVTHLAVTTSALTVNGPVTVQIVTVTATYSILTTDNIVVVDGTSAAFNAMLPAPGAVGAGRIVTLIKKDNAHNVTILPNGAETINGASSKVLSTQYGVTRFICDGTNWYSA